MKLLRLLAVSVFVLVATRSLAQSKEEFVGPSRRESMAAPEEPVHQKKVFTHRRVKGFKYKRPKVTHTAQYEFYERVEEAARERQRLLKKLYKPQYSNFLYYGHKQKPKKHSPDKMKYCKECGIRH